MVVHRTRSRSSLFLLLLGGLISIVVALVLTPAVAQPLAFTEAPVANKSNGSTTADNWLDAVARETSRAAWQCERAKDFHKEATVRWREMKTFLDGMEQKRAYARRLKAEAIDDDGRKPTSVDREVMAALDYALAAEDESFRVGRLVTMAMRNVSQSIGAANQAIDEAMDLIRKGHERLRARFEKFLEEEKTMHLNMLFKRGVRQRNAFLDGLIAENMAVRVELDALGANVRTLKELTTASAQLADEMRKRLQEGKRRNWER
jgi:hypothetical protein